MEADTYTEPLTAALEALDRLAQVEVNTQIGPVAEGMAALLRSFDGRPAFPSDLLMLAAASLAEASEQSAAAASLVFSPQVETRHLHMPSLIADLRNAAVLVR
jgi:hypothetical protein